MRSKKGQQQPRLQISTALLPEQYDILNQCRDKHNVTMAQVIMAGVEAINSDSDEPTPDLTDTTPAPHQEA